MFSRNFFQSFNCLKFRVFVDHVQNWTVINIHDIYDDREVEINFFAQNEFESF